MLTEFDDCAFDGVHDALFQERRRGLRPATPVHAALFPDVREERETDEVEILAVNLTSHGVGMELARDVPVGAIYNISIGIGEQALRSHVKITSCLPRADGIYRAGGELC